MDDNGLQVMDDTALHVMNLLPSGEFPICFFQFFLFQGYCSSPNVPDSEKLTTTKKSTGISICDIINNRPIEQ